MTNLQKSIRSALKYYGPALRNGHWGVSGYTCGLVPDDYKTLMCACCDYDGKLVTDIRIYAYGDAMLERDYYDDSIDITAPIENYLTDGGTSWDDMIRDIETLLKEQEQE